MDSDHFARMTRQDFSRWRKLGRAKTTGRHSGWPDIYDTTVSRACIDIASARFAAHLEHINLHQVPVSGHTKVYASLGFIDSVTLNSNAHVHVLVSEYEGGVEEYTDEEKEQLVRVQKGLMRGWVVGDESLFGDIAAALGPND